VSHSDRNTQCRIAAGGNFDCARHFLSARSCHVADGEGFSLLRDGQVNTNERNGDDENETLHEATPFLIEKV
jgi:hypothetical protein